MDRALFLTGSEIEVIVRLLPTLDGTARRTPGAIMETPNQPIGGSMQILQLWNTFFPPRPGHWRGFEIETYPVITQIAFTDTARTRAAVAITVGYSGGTLLLEKTNGQWRVVELTTEWIT